MTPGGSGGQIQAGFPSQGGNPAAPSPPGFVWSLGSPIPGAGGDASSFKPCCHHSHPDDPSPSFLPSAHRRCLLPGHRATAGLHLLCTVGMRLAPTWESFIMFLQAERSINLWLKPLVPQGNGSSSIYHLFQTWLSRGLRTRISLNGPEQPHLDSPPTSLGPGALFKLSSWPLLISYGGGVLVWYLLSFVLNLV